MQITKKIVLQFNEDDSFTEKLIVPLAKQSKQDKIQCCSYPD